MSIEDDVTQSHEGNLAEFAALYAEALQAYENARQQAYSDFNTELQTLEAAHIALVAESFGQYNQRHGEITAAFEEAKLDTIQQIAEQTQEVDRARREDLADFVAHYAETSGLSESLRDKALGEFTQALQEAKNSYTQALAEANRKIQEGLQSYADVTNEQNGVYQEAVATQASNMQRGESLWNQRKAEVDLVSLSTKNFLAEARRAKVDKTIVNED